MTMLRIADVVKEEYKKAFENRLNEKDMERLLEMLNVTIYSILTMSASATPRTQIRILINPDKFSAEDFISIEDDWVEYITNEKGLDPKDAIMITPF